VQAKSIIAAVTISIAAAGTAVTAIPAHAATAATTASSGEATFCRDWGRFGDGPSYSTFIAVHQAAEHADSASRRAYDRFEAVLLAGYPTNVIRTDSGNVWKTCGD
jgi:hypothetical protein